MIFAREREREGDREESNRNKFAGSYRDESKMLKGIWGQSSFDTAKPSPRRTHIKDSAHSLKRCQGSESLPISSPSPDSSSLGIYKEISWTSDISMTVPKLTLQQSSQSHTSSFDDLGLPDINKGKKKIDVSKSARGSKTARGTSPQKTRESHIDLLSSCCCVYSAAVV